MMELNMDNSNFAYTATIKLDELPKCGAQTDFPGVADLAVNSRNFQNFHDCSNSVKKFMDNVVERVNDDMPDDGKYIVLTEVNPTYSGVDTKSKDWTAGELARLWMFPQNQEEENTIQAVGQARVFKLANQPAKHLN